MTGIVNTAITARISAGTIVHEISSTVLPWTCFGLRCSPGFSRNRSATKIVPPTTPTPMTTAIQKNGVNRSRIGLASGPAGSSEFCPLSLPPPPQLASTASAASTAAPLTAPRRSRCIRSNICLPRPRGATQGSLIVRRRDGDVLGTSRRDSTAVASAHRNSVISQHRGRRIPAPRFRGPRRSSEWARRCQSGSTFTCVSRWTRTPSRASSSRRASVPACLSTAPPRPITMPFCDSRSTRTTTRSASSGPLRRLPLLDLLGRDRDRVRQLVAGDREQLLADELGGEERLGLIA